MKVSGSTLNLLFIRSSKYVEATFPKSLRRSNVWILRHGLQHDLTVALQLGRGASSTTRPA